MKKLKWRKQTHNEVLDGDGFFVSYNNKPNEAFGGFSKDIGEIGNILLDIIGDNRKLETDGRSETALMKGNDYYILNGDFRGEYEKLAPLGFEACYKFYKDHSEHRSNWSNDES